MKIALALFFKCLKKPTIKNFDDLYDLLDRYKILPNWKKKCCHTF